ncbi:transposase [Streptomyces massasporeus]|uniref:transposase n=1 Tax=Streptomyces massasporeus TaxID=67324 RepID=UPI0036E0919D
MVSDELWSLIEPLLSVPGRKLASGGPWVPDRQALCGILFVLHTGIQGECLPQELGFGSGMTCWRRLAAWNEAGVWDQQHVVLLEKLRSADKLDWFPGGDRRRPRQVTRRGPTSDPAISCWVVERTISWLHSFRRLRIRWEPGDDIHEAFLDLATCLITHRHVQRLGQGHLEPVFEPALRSAAAPPT